MANVKKVDRRRAQTEFFCIVCQDPIPHERFIRKAITCCPEHGRIVKCERRRLHDMTRCRLCGRGSTPQERADFAAFKKARGVKPGPKPKPKLESIESPLEQHLGTIAVQ